MSGEPSIALLTFVVLPNFMSGVMHILIKIDKRRVATRNTNKFKKRTNTTIIIKR